MVLRDYGAVVALWGRTPGVSLDADADSRAGLRRFLQRNPGMSFVATEGAAVVGAVLSGHDSRRGYLHHLAVDAGQRGRGAGRLLVAACLAALARCGIPKCNIFVMRRNRPGQAFWRHLGWTPRSDLVLMQARTAGPAAGKPGSRRR